MSDSHPNPFTEAASVRLDRKATSKIHPSLVSVERMRHLKTHGLDDFLRHWLHRSLSSTSHSIMAHLSQGWIRSYLSRTNSNPTHQRTSILITQTARYLQADLIPTVPINTPVHRVPLTKLSAGVATLQEILKYDESEELMNAVYLPRTLTTLDQDSQEASERNYYSC